MIMECVKESAGVVCEGYSSAGGLIYSYMALIGRVVRAGGRSGFGKN